MQVYVYVVQHPITCEPKFVGVTAHPTQIYPSFATQRRPTLQKWITSLSSAPVITVISDFPSLDQAKMYAYETAKQLKRKGAGILNFSVQDVPADSQWTIETSNQFLIDIDELNLLLSQEGKQFAAQLSAQYKRQGNAKLPRLRDAWYVYALRSHDVGELRYIGCSGDIMVRLAAHIRTRSSTAVSCWIDSHLPAVPIMEPLAKFDDREAALDYETYLIRILPERGARLLNNDGGHAIALTRTTEEHTRILENMQAAKARADALARKLPISQIRVPKRFTC